MAKIPTFKNEEELREFWDTHDFTDYIDNTEEVDIKLVDKRPEKKRTTIYMTQGEHEKLRRIAFAQNISMAEFVRRAVRDKIRKLA